MSRVADDVSSSISERAVASEDDPLLTATE